MFRRIVICLPLTVFLLTVSFAEAQQPAKIPRIGFVSGAGDSQTPGFQVNAFRQGLRNLGYIEGKNILVEYRYAEGNQDRIPGLVAELVQLKVEVLVVGGQADPRRQASDQDDSNCHGEVLSIRSRRGWWIAWHARAGISRGSPY